MNISRVEIIVVQPVVIHQHEHGVVHVVEGYVFDESVEGSAG